MRPAPWTDQLPELTDVQIQKRIERLPLPAHQLNQVDGAFAAMQLANRFDNSLVVSSQILTKVCHIYRNFRASFLIRYPSEKEYFRVLQSEEFMGPVLSPICLTGPAGVGKSQLLRGLKEILVFESPLFEPVKGIAVEGKAYIYQKIKKDMSAAHIHRSACAMLEGKKDGPKHAALEYLCSEGFRRGLAAIAIDELQHLTLSQGANAQVTGTLLGLRDTGIPIIYGCNYSLVRRLLLRPHEDRDRVLSNIIHLNAESPRSTDWMRSVDHYLKAAPGAFRITAYDHAEILGSLTACLNRMLRDLLVCSYRRVREIGRSEVTIDDVLATYKHIAYAAARKTVEELEAQAATGRYIKPDLSLPDELREKVEYEEAEARAKASRLHAEASVVASSSLTASERKELKRIEAERARPKDRTTARRSRGAAPSESDMQKGLDYIRTHKKAH